MAVKVVGRPRVFCSESCTQKAWAKAHPEVIAVRREKNYAKFGEHIRAKSRDWGRKNVARARARNSAWQKTENGKAQEKAKAHTRRTRLLGTGGKFTAAEFKALCLATGCVCLECRKTFLISKLEADHIVPVARGGSSNIGNIQPLCRDCNARKNTDTMNWLTDYALEGVVINDPSEYRAAA